MRTNASGYTTKVTDENNAKHGGAEPMVVLGIILLILGFVFSVPILWTLGIILIIIGIILWIAEGVGASWGRRWY